MPSVNGTGVLSDAAGDFVHFLPMRVLIVTHFWTPEVGAPQTRLRETAIELLRRGWDVRVLTNHPHYPDGRVRDGYEPLRVTRDRTDGLLATRLPVLARPNRGFWDRLVDQGSFAFTAAAAALSDLLSSAAMAR